MTDMTLICIAAGVYMGVALIGWFAGLRRMGATGAAIGAAWLPIVVVAAMWKLWRKLRSAKPVEPCFICGASTATPESAICKECDDV